MKPGYCVAPACTSELHPVADQVPHAPSMTPVAMEHRHRLADVLGHVDEVDYHTVRSTAALARSNRVSAPSTSATHPGAQPAPSRSRLRVAFLQTPLRALDIVGPLDRTGGLPRGALIEVSLQEPAHQLLAPSVQLPFELALTHLLGFAR